MKKIYFYGLILSFFLVWLHVSALDVDKVRISIKEKGARWIASENRLTRLSLDEQRKLLGMLDDPHSSLSRKLKPSSLDISKTNSLKTLPTSLDWRSLDGQNWVSPVRDQNPWGTCVAFSSLSCLESILKIQSGNPALDIDLSERFLFTYGGGHEVLGWWATQAADFLMTVGVIPESACPYSEWDGSFPVDSPQGYLSSNPTYMIEDWNDVVYLYIPNQENEDKVKTALMEAPIVSSLYVYEDFISYSGGVYERVSGNLLGPHAVLLIGWDDSQDCWICKNSWGEFWGESGFFRIKKSNMGNSNFPRSTTRFIPRSSPGMCYYFGSGLPAPVPDAGSLSTNADVRGLVGATDITLQISLLHNRMEDISCSLISPLSVSSVPIYQKPASSTYLTGFFLNDKSLWTISELISAKSALGMANYSGCTKPDNPLSPLLYYSPYGFWNLIVSDTVSGESGFLKGWGVYFAAIHVTQAQPDLWMKY